MSGLPNLIPFPPLEYRQNVGAVDLKRYENPTGELIYPTIAPHYYRRFFDQDSAVFYLSEVNHILAEDGILHASWFLFDKTDFPMMQDFQNALYINLADPVNAVIFDKAWVANEAQKQNLKIIAVRPPSVRGGQWMLTMARVNHPSPEVKIPSADTVSSKNWKQRLGARLKFG